LAITKKAGAIVLKYADYFFCSLRGIDTGQQ